MFLSRLPLLSAVVFLTASSVLAQAPSSAQPAPSAARALPPSQEGPPLKAGPAAPAAAAVQSGPQITFNSVYVDGPFIAITFDDGPHGTLTPKLLDMLAARRLKATFFVVGECVAEFPEIVKRAAREGHEIASHSWSHPNLGKMSDDAVRSQLQKTDDAIKAAIGVRPALMRPPYGSITPRQKSWIHETFGYKTIIWDVDPFDWKRPGPAVVRDRIVNQSKPGSIILAHDIHAATVEAMPATFDQLTAKGFKFVTVSELLAMARPAPPKPSSTPASIARPPAAEPIPVPSVPASPAASALPNG
ncbi:MAG: polysaccharide deacetylase family protein [Chthoniobacterales bacterium]|nr:polysaccharide deacetylase family protein [Chthoniobacterales bacterium]